MTSLRMIALASLYVKLCKVFAGLISNVMYISGLIFLSALHWHFDRSMIPQWFAKLELWRSLY